MWSNEDNTVLVYICGSTPCTEKNSYKNEFILTSYLFVHIVQNPWSRERFAQGSNDGTQQEPLPLPHAVFEKECSNHML